MDHRQAVDRLLGLEHVVGHEQHGTPVRAEGTDLLPKQAPAKRIDIVRGLVEDHHATGTDDGHAEADEAPDAAGQATAERTPPFAEVERVDQRGCTRLDVPRAPTADAAGQLDRLGDVERIDRHLHLRQVRAQLPCRIGVGDEVETTERDTTGGRFQETDCLLDERGLACSVWAEQTVDLARLDAKRDVVVGGECAELFGESVDAERPVVRWPLDDVEGAGGWAEGGEVIASRR